MKLVDPTSVVDLVTAGLAHRTANGDMQSEAVGAVDIVTHTLIFTGHPDSLQAWRAALWDGALAPAARASVEVMVARLNESIAVGNTDAVTEICDCLETLFSDTEESQQEATRGG